MIKDGINGFLINSNNIEDLSNKIIEVLENRDRTFNVSKNSQEIINKYWPTWEERAEMELKLIESLNNGNINEVKQKYDSKLRIENIIKL